MKLDQVFCIITKQWFIYNDTQKSNVTWSLRPKKYWVVKVFLKKIDQNKKKLTKIATFT